MSNLGTTLAGLGFKKRGTDAVVPDTNLFNGKDYDTFLSEVGAVAPQLEEDIDGQAVISTLPSTLTQEDDQPNWKQYQVTTEKMPPSTSLSDMSGGVNYTWDGKTLTTTGSFCTALWDITSKGVTSGRIYIEVKLESTGTAYSLTHGSYFGIQRTPTKFGNYHNGLSGNGNGAESVVFTFNVSEVGVTKQVIIDLDTEELIVDGVSQGVLGGAGDIYFGIWDGASTQNGALSINFKEEDYVYTRPDDCNSWFVTQEDVYINGLIQELESTLTKDQSIVQVVGGYNYTMAVLNDGTVKAAGINDYGQLGIGNTTNQSSWVTSNITDVKSIACNYDHTVAVLNDGTVKAVGRNNYGQLGNGNTTDQSSWVTSNITNVKSIQCGYGCTMAVLNDGTVKGVGYNGYGQLGIGNTTSQSSWVTSNITDVKSIAGSSYFIFALLNDGTVKCVGRNNFGQLGIGNTTNQSSWVTSGITEDVKSISCSFYSHTVAVLNDGTVKAVGRNNYGQLGNGNTTQQTSWVTSNITDVDSIVCGYFHAAAVLNDGTVKCIGHNGSGQLGNGNTTNQSSWVTSNITDVDSIVCGGYHTMAVLNDGTVKGVGYNGYGQLGDGTTTGQSSWVTSTVPIETIITNTYVAQTVDTNELTISGTADSLTIDLWV